MKFALNGALLLSTKDGCNTEVVEKIGSDNMFLFGLNAADVEKQIENGYDATKYYQSIPELKVCIDQIQNGFFCEEEPNKFRVVVDTLLKDDNFLTLADYSDYVKTQNEVIQTFENKKTWHEKVIRAISCCGHFSSDRSVAEYARRIWGVEPSWVKQLPPNEPIHHN